MHIPMPSRAQGACILACLVAGHLSESNTLIPRLAGDDDAHDSIQPNVPPRGLLRQNKETRDERGREMCGWEGVVTPLPGDARDVNDARTCSLLQSI